MLIHGDCITEMRKLQPETFRVVVTSPPYNLLSTTTKKTNSTWKNSKLMNEGYDGYSDNLPHEQYVKWQRECLTEMMRVLRNDGAIFYNHHWRVQKGILQTRNDIIEGFPLRQILIWNRGGGVNFNPGYFMPNYEVIYMIAKPDFKLAQGMNTAGSVWNIKPETNNPHPAPYPVELAKKIILSVGEGPVLDPFIGSGTTGVAANECGVDWVGIDQSAEYIDMANKRINKGVTPPLF